MYHGERFNAWSHLIGALFALTGSVWLIVHASLHADARTIASVSIYGGCMVLLYAISTLYHSVRGKAKRILQKFDHLSIYLMIAGSYTPFCLVSLRGAWGWSLLAAIWSLALIGMLQEIKPRTPARVLSLVLYAIMGWMVLIALEPLVQALGSAGFMWLAAGGLFYTVGILFFALDGRMPHSHGIWHLFVIAGSLLHFITIVRYVLP
ncbi:MAG: hemolysin III family protein [Comamonadaceae bacterium]|nr:hemolysin III family protein [Comamonadaceae bacterium]